MNTELKERPGRLIKRTRSICPECLEPLDATVNERDGQVWLDKACPAHGSWSALLASDSKHYFEPTKSQDGTVSCCGSSCNSGGSTTPQWSNHSCTVLIEITERCNLACPTCFAGSSPQHSRMMSLDTFKQQVDGLLSGGKGNADMIQLSGGEPTIHPEFFDMVYHLAECGFPNVTINSNGIKLARPAFVERLANCVNGTETELYVYLQFDGFESDTYRALRGRSDLLDVKNRAIENCIHYGLDVHPVMTLTRGINDHEVGQFIELAARHPEINNVVLQPAMYSGRYDNPRRVDRLTLADAVRLVCDQFGVFEPRDFMPIPCSDPNCLGIAVALRAGDEFIALSRYLPAYETWGEAGTANLIEQISDTIDGPRALADAIEWVMSDSDNIFRDVADEDVDRLLDILLEQADGRGEGGSSLWDALFVVSIKPFMDAYTYDQDRIDGCCVHILDENGNPVSFCEFNAVYRPRRAARQAASIHLVEA